MQQDVDCHAVDVSCFTFDRDTVGDDRGRALSCGELKAPVEVDQPDTCFRGLFA
jgi:hypothetical protein